MSLLNNVLLKNRIWNHTKESPKVETKTEEDDNDITLEIGDWIQCKDRETMINTMHDLIMDGIETEFCYYKHGVKGLWLKVINVE